MLSNLPPGCRDCDLPGANDKTVSFTITFPYEIFNDDNEPLTDVIHEYTEVKDLIINVETIEHNIDDSYSVMLTYSDDIELDMSYVEDYCDIEEEIIKYINELVLDARLDYRDERIEIDYEVHQC